MVIVADQNFKLNRKRLKMNSSLIALSCLIRTSKKSITLVQKYRFVRSPVYNRLLCQTFYFGPNQSSACLVYVIMRELSDSRQQTWTETQLRKSKRRLKRKS